jgi:hypothetical protein
MAAVLKTASRGDLARGFESHALRTVMSQDIEDTANPHKGRGVFFGQLAFGRVAWAAAGVARPVSERCGRLVL